MSTPIDLSRKLQQIQAAEGADQNSPEGIERLKEQLKNYEGEDKLVWWDDILEQIKNEPEKTLHKTGIDELDNILGGFQEKQLAVVAGDSGHGKCLGKGTGVLMHDGSVKKVEDIEVGDKLMGPDSQPRRVLSLARGKEEMYKVSQRGAEYVVNKSHILSLKTNGRFNKKGEKYNVGKIVNISVADYLKKTPAFKTRYCGWMTGVDFAAKNVTVEPYFLGVWLGDGTCADSSITNSDWEIQKYLEEYAGRLGRNYRKIVTEGKAPKLTITNRSGGDPATKESLTGYLRELNLIKNKHIPSEYKCNSRDIRLQVLAGLIDADGYLYQRNGTSYDLVQKSKRLADDIVFLCRSLGLMAVVSECTKGIKSTGFTGTYYRIRISGDIGVIPVKVERRKVVDHKSKTNVLTSRIHVEPLGMGDYYGFEIDGDGLFLLDSFVVTHNTSMGIFMLHCLKELNPIMIPLEQSADELIRQRVQNGYEVPTILSPQQLSNAVTPEWIEERIIEGIAKYNTKVVLIDHLGYIDNYGPDGKLRRENLAYRVGEVMRDLKGIAKRWDVIIFLLVHISQHDEGQPPSRKDIKNSSDIIQESDIGIFVWRKNEVRKKIRVYDDKTLISVQKNRRTGKNESLGMSFNHTTGWYEEENTWVKQMEESARQAIAFDEDDDW